jgi:DNA-binding CsgD family transcriptional regulator
MSKQRQFKEESKALSAMLNSPAEYQAIDRISSCSTIFNFDDVNFVVAYKDLDHRLLHVNQKTLQYNGLKNLKDIVNKRDSDLSWHDYSEIYEKQETDAVNGVLYSALHPGTDIDGRDFLFFNRKYPWRDEKNNIIGIICHSVEIENSDLIALGHKLKKNAHFASSPIHYLGKPCGIEKYHFTPREQECLFFMIRGKTAKCIAKIIGISYRTVEYYFEKIKIKMQCHTKSEVINKAIENGFVDIIPKSLSNLVLLNSFLDDD